VCLCVVHLYLHDPNSHTAQWEQLWREIPNAYRSYKLSRIFTTADHGYSLSTFYKMSTDHHRTILLVKTTEDQVFGAFLLSDWSA
jgi:hypothetical protein